MELDKNLLTDDQWLAMETVSFKSKFQTKVMEDTEMFLFRTVQPFCETITERRIEKKDLEQALVKHFPRDVMFCDNSMTKLPVSSCPSCFEHINMYAYGESNKIQQYCPYCGQHINWKEGAEGCRLLNISRWFMIVQPTFTGSWC